MAGRVSPVPNHTFHTYRFLYTEGFLRGASQYLPTFHGLRPYAQGSTSLCSLFRDLFFTIRQNSLNVAVCMIARTSFEVTLPTRLAPCITATHRVWLHGSLAITVTGLTPASVVQLRWTHDIKLARSILFLSTGLLMKFQQLHCLHLHFLRLWSTTLCFLWTVPPAFILLYVLHFLFQWIVPLSLFSMG